MSEENKKTIDVAELVKFGEYLKRLHAKTGLSRWQILIGI
jgi:hypothetical protein